MSGESLGEYHEFDETNSENGFCETNTNKKKVLIIVFWIASVVSLGVGTWMIIQFPGPVGIVSFFIGLILSVLFIFLNPQKIRSNA